MDRASRLHGSNLFRLRRLLQHGDRARSYPWLYVAAEFPAALYVTIDHRILASLAHIPFQLAARLPLHSPGRKPRGRSANIPQFGDCFPALRIMARRELELRALGSLARDLSGD